ncbi:MAG: hypothetical protein JNL83_36550 [Myxococcales bacterium]|nr:hypothetical protein [Myxococcales bacterium]
MWRRVVDCLGIAIGARADDAEAIALATGVLRSYAETTAAPDVDYAIEVRTEPVLVRNGEVIGTGVRPVDLVPQLEIDLYRQLIARARGVPLHAGAVVDRDGNAVIVCGASGSGKSTLVRALLVRGLSYLSEEYIALVGGGRCRGLARALNIEDPALPVPEGYTSDDYVLPHGTSRMFHPPERAIWRGDARALAIVSISHAPDAGDAVVPMTSGEAVVALWPAMFHHSAESLAELPSAFEGIRLYRMHTRTPAAALSCLLATARNLGFRD